MDISDRVIVITGASRGIGKELAREFSNRGASLAILARSKELLDEIARSLPGNVMALPCDVTDEQQLARSFDHLTEKLGRVDSVIVNAGSLLSPELAAKMPMSLWRSTVELNLTGAFATAKVAYSLLRESEAGRLVFISSRASTNPTRGMSAYAAAKAGLEGLVRALAVEWSADGICVNAVSLGFIDEGGTKNISEKSKARIISKSALGRPGYIADIVGPITLLAGGDAAYVTGQTIPVDGGYGLA